MTAGPDQHHSSVVPTDFAADPGALVGRKVRRSTRTAPRYTAWAQIVMTVPSRDGVCWLVAFFDGEEAVNREWKDPDNRYGSRQMAAKLAMSDDLPKIRAFLLADIVGSRELRIKRDANSDKALTDLVWATAKNLGYSGVFVNDPTSIEDDHQSFSARGVRTVDVIDLEIPYWHTAQDSLDKISSKSLAIVGHVFVESVKQLQMK